MGNLCHFNGSLSGCTLDLSVEQQRPQTAAINQYSYPVIMQEASSVLQVNSGPTVLMQKLSKRNPETFILKAQCNVA